MCDRRLGGGGGAVMWRLVLLVVAWTPARAGAQCLPLPHGSEDARALNQFWGTRIVLCNAPGTNNAQALIGTQYVFADQRWLDNIARTIGPWAATGVLAHEWGHMVAASPPRTGAELQADCLAGVFLKANGLSRENFSQFHALSRRLGDPVFNRAGHGTAAMRATAARHGYQNYTGQAAGALAALCPPDERWREILLLYR